MAIYCYGYLTLIKLSLDCKTVPFFVLDNQGEHQVKARRLGRVSVILQWMGRGTNSCVTLTLPRSCAFAWRSLDYPSTKKGTVLQSKFLFEQKRARKTNFDWKDVTSSAQARNVCNGDSKSILRAVRMIFQLGYKESVECYYTEMHVESMRSLLIGCYTHMAAMWKTSDTWKWNSEKGQELAKLSKGKARNLWEHKMQDAQWQLGSEERKAQNGEQGGRKCNFPYRAVPSTSSTLHNHWLLLVYLFIYLFISAGFLDTEIMLNCS